MFCKAAIKTTETGCGHDGRRRGPGQGWSPIGIRACRPLTCQRVASRRNGRSGAANAKDGRLPC